MSGEGKGFFLLVSLEKNSSRNSDWLGFDHLFIPSTVAKCGGGTPNGSAQVTGVSLRAGCRKFYKKKGERDRNNDSP